MRRKDAELHDRLELEAGWRDGGLVPPYGAVKGQKLGLLLQSLLDGGLVNHVPVSVARQMGATRVIAVDVGSPLYSRDQLRTPIDVAYQMVSVIMKERTDRELATLTANDLLLSPALGEFSFANFPEAASTIAPGEAAAREAGGKLAAFAVPEAPWLAWRHTQRLADT
jgi:NTE family protein